jgi:RNA polymerase sigma factor (sigma-70 family)
MTDPRTLLAQYVASGSEDAFGELVGRYLNLVYSTAVRLVDGDRHRAEDVAQTVFADLARLAKTLSPEVMLGGWLHRRTWHVAATLMRSERRRQNRERLAGEMQALQDPSGGEYEQIVPILDEAVNQLSAADRQVILLRYFEGQELRAVGQALATTEEAARKRVARALDKLRGLLRRQGVAISCTSLAALLAAQAVTAAPAGMAVSVTSAALASAASGGGVTLAIFKIMAMTRLKIAVSAVVVAGLGTTLVLEHHALARLREQNRALQDRLGQYALVEQDHQRLSNLVAQSSARAALTPDQFQDLLKLRGEVGLARRLNDENPKLRAENIKLRSAAKQANTPAPKEPEDPAEAAFQKETNYRRNFGSQWGLLFITSASKNNGQSPDTWEQVASQMRPEELQLATNDFEIVFHGKLPLDGSQENVLLFREKEARQSPGGEWFKVYGFADGRTEIHTEPNGNFEAWERPRLAGSK